MADIDAPPYIEYGSDLVIIREIFDGANELFENELEHALDIGCQTIVIEPCRLGEETARWIYVGECLHRTSILTGIGSIVSGWLWSDRPLIQYSLAFSSALFNTMHTLSWQSDICSTYRVDRRQDYLAKLVGASGGGALQRFKHKKSSSSSVAASDTISLVTSTENIHFQANQSINDDDTSVSGDDQQQQQQQQQPQHQQQQHQQQSSKLYGTPPTSSSKKQQQQQKPVILCRRSDKEVTRANWIKAAVSLLALAYSVVRLFKTTISVQSNILFNFDQFGQLIKYSVF